MCSFGSVSTDCMQFWLCEGAEVCSFCSLSANCGQLWQCEGADCLQL